MFWIFLVATFITARAMLVSQYRMRRTLEINKELDGEFKNLARLRYLTELHEELLNTSMLKQMVELKKWKYRDFFKHVER